RRVWSETPHGRRARTCVPRPAEGSARAHRACKIVDARTQPHRTAVTTARARRRLSSRPCNSGTGSLQERGEISVTLTRPCGTAPSCASRRGDFATRVADGAGEDHNDFAGHGASLRILALGALEAPRALGPRHL